MIFHCPVQISYVYLNEIKVVVVVVAAKPTDRLMYQIAFLQIANCISMTENFQKRSKSMQMYLIANRGNVPEEIAKTQRSKLWPCSIIPSPRTCTD